MLEVEKLTQTINELEESILATGEVANVVHFYQNQATKLNVHAILVLKSFKCWIPWILLIYKIFTILGGKEDPWEGASSSKGLCQSCCIHSSKWMERWLWQAHASQEMARRTKAPAGTILSHIWNDGHCPWPDVVIIIVYGELMD